MICPSLRRRRQVRPTTSECVEQYLAYCRRRSLSEHTVRGYGRMLRDFAFWAEDRHPADISAAEVEMGFLTEWSQAFEKRHQRPCADGC